MFPLRLAAFPLLSMVTAWLGGNFETGTRLIWFGGQVPEVAILRRLDGALPLQLPMVGQGDL